MMKRALLFLSALLLASSLAAPVAEAVPKGWVFKDNDTHRFDLSVQAAYRPAAVIGFWADAGIPLAKEGFSDKINDAFFLEVAIFSGGFPGPPGFNTFTLSPQVGVRYQLYLFDWFSVFWAVRGGPEFWLVNGAVPATPFISGGFGMMLTISDKFFARFDLGWPIAAGVGWEF